MPELSLEKIVAAFGQSAKAKLSNPAISGSPEDQLRGPLEVLIGDGLAGLAGLSGSVSMVGETNLADIKTRPDYAVTVGKALVGFVEVKSPGKGADPRKFSDDHDKGQWARLKSLPNLIYTDGNAFSLWRDGKLQGRIVPLEGDIETSGAKLKAPAELVALFSDFFAWAPIPPKTPKRLVEVSARLCRLLRDEVAEQMARGSPGLTGLAQDWRKLLFPDADDARFADGYAQAVTFGLLIARTRGIPLDDGIDRAAADLRKSSSLIGTALGLLTDDLENRNALKTSLDTMTRVLNEVNWAEISKEDPDAWLYFYEHFLEVYDNKLRKLTGSYYTPPEVVNAMVRLVDEVLRGPLFERGAGLASADVTVADPAVGTGTFLLGVLRRIAATVAADFGPGGVPGEIGAAADRLVGFELQFGPFAVAQLRLIAEFQEFMKATGHTSSPLPKLQLFITNTLANPFVEEEQLMQFVQPIAASRREANAIKRGKPITVVIGNPPYKVDAGGQGGWIEAGSAGRPSAMDLWTPPASWGVGRSAKHLKNLYVFFWRWATWKVFGSGHASTTGEPDVDRCGLVCFITASGFLNGPGFQRMREELRRDCTDIWVIDCSPEGFQPGVPTRIFQGVQQPVCIVLAARAAEKSRTLPARIRCTALPEGRQAEKFAALSSLSLDGEVWVDGPTGWREPLLPEHGDRWAAFLPLADLFEWASPGVKTHRTWVIAPDAQSLERRWTTLQGETSPLRKTQLFHPDSDRTLDKIVETALGPHPTRPVAVENDKGPVVSPVRYAFRSFDRQWIVPDHRLLSRARSKLWDTHSSRQIYLTALEAHSPSSGPAVTFAGDVPDNDHYKGSFAGHVFPLWRDVAAAQANMRPSTIAVLAANYGQAVTIEDMIAYVAAVMAQSAYTARFQRDLIRPGLRVPITADAALFTEAAALGRQVIWLHCHGERFHDAAAGRPKAPPRLPTAPFRRRLNLCPT